MRVLYVTPEYAPQPGGVGDYTACLAAAVQAQGAAVTVLTTQHPTAAPTAHDTAGVRVLRRVPAWDMRCWHSITTAVAAVRPSVLHIQYQTGGYAMHPAINFLPGYLRRIAPGCASVVTLHDLLEPYLFPKAGGLRRAVTMRLVRSVAACIATNAPDAATLRARGHAPATLATIPIGSNIAVQPPAGYTRAAWRQQHGIPPGALVVGYFGLLAAAKGVDTLLAAVEHLAACGRDLWLLLIGGAATAPHDRTFAAQFAQTLQQSPVAARVVQTGHVTAAAVSGHLLACDMVALPFAGGVSLRSGSLLAAMAHGVPVVTTTPPDGTAPPLRADHDALLVRPGDAAQLAVALARLADDARLQAQLAAGARAFAAPFAWDAIATAHLRLYATLTTTTDS